MQSLALDEAGVMCPMLVCDSECMYEMCQYLPGKYQYLFWQFGCKLTDTTMPRGPFRVFLIFTRQEKHQQHLQCPSVNNSPLYWGNGIVIVRLAEWPVPLWGLSEG
jgi:hypothetical protein